MSDFERLVNAVIRQESGGNPNAVSNKGARGLGQVMPKTSRDPGFGVRPLQSNSPSENVRFTADYLSAMMDRYNGDVPKALAAYNAGPGAVDKHNGVPPYKETQNYVSKILSSLNPISEAQASEIPYKPTFEEFVKMKQQGLSMQSDEPKTKVKPTFEEFVSQKLAKEGIQYHGRNVTDMGATGQFLTGVGNKVIDLGRGASQILGVHPGGFGNEQDIAESRQLSEALGKTGAGKAGNIAGNILPFALTGGGATIPSLVAKSAAMSALEPTKETTGINSERIINAASGAAGGLIGGAAGKALGGVVNGFTPSADAAALIKQGIQPTVGQGIDKTGWIGKGISKAEEATTSLPLLGGITTHARQRALKEGINTAIKQAEDKTLGVSANGKLGHEAINNLKQTFNEAYEKAMQGHTMSLAPAVPGIMSKINDPARFVNDAERKSIITGIQGLFDKIQPQANGQYLASDIHNIESALKTQARSLPFGDDKAKILSDVQKEIAKYRTEALPPHVSEIIKKLDSKYVNFTRLRKAAEGVGAEHGEFSPAQLYNAATVMGKKSGQASTGSAPMQKLAGQMKSVLSDKLGDSGTAPRMLTNRMLIGGAGEAATAGFSAPLYAGTGLAMLAGSSRAAQKALLGGYKVQPKIAYFVNKSGKPIAAVTSMSLRDMANRKQK